MANPVLLPLILDQIQIQYLFQWKFNIHMRDSSSNLRLNFQHCSLQQPCLWFPMTWGFPGLKTIDSNGLSLTVTLQVHSFPLKPVNFNHVKTSICLSVNPFPFGFMSLPEFSSIELVQ